MLDVGIVNETYPEANWNRWADRQTGRQTDKPMCWEAAPPKMRTTSIMKTPPKIETSKIVGCILCYLEKLLMTTYLESHSTTYPKPKMDFPGMERNVRSIVYVHT